MKFRTKIKISFIAITMIPTILIFSLVFGVVMLQKKIVEDKYNVDDISIYGMIDQTEIYNKITHKIYNDMVEKAETSPGDLISVDYLKKMNDKVDDKYSFVMAYKDGVNYYNGSNYTIEDMMEKYKDSIRGHSVSFDNQEIVIYDNDKYIIKKIILNYNNSEYRVYIITDMENILPQLKHMIWELLIVIITVVVLTAIVFALWIQRSVLHQLNRLTEATKRIAEGDLDFTLERTSKDEFGDLCEDFENMRSRLKENAQARIRDDEENKELISNISHDLKTPITAIKGYVEGIMDGVADTPQKMNKYIRTIYNKTNDMDKLIGELTMFSKIDTNRVTYNFTIVNVEAYFSDCVEEINVELESKNISLNYMNYVDKNTEIIADPEQLKRVINNIISNAVKYIGKKRGIVNIRINDDGEFIHVEIEDNGKGIEQKDLNYIFDRFYRTDSSRNSNQGGSGIGLAIVKKIIEVHGGRIWATSRVDIGTVIHFVIRKYYEKENDYIEEDINNRG